jgi:hypothetical protein
MSTVATIKQMFEETYPLVDFVVDDLSLAELKKVHDGATIMSILAIYTHIALAEDWMIQDLVKGGKQLWESAGWAAKTGLEEKNGFITEEQAQGATDAQWAEIKAYTSAVRASTLAYLETATDEDLAQPKELYGKPRTIGYVVANYAFFHILQHQGEIAALKGVMGKKGMPY